MRMSLISANLCRISTHGTSSCEENKKARETKKTSEKPDEIIASIQKLMDFLKDKGLRKKRLLISKWIFPE